MSHINLSNTKEDILKVGAKTEPKKLAGAITATIKEGKRCVLHCVGAGAVNTAAKAVAVARGFLSPHGLEAALQPSFGELEIEGETRTFLRFTVVTWEI